MNAPIPEESLARIREALLRRRKIEAIKLYRESTGEGLTESKQAVEKIEAELRTANPEEFRAADTRKFSIIGVAINVIVMVWLITRLTPTLRRKAVSCRRAKPAL